MQWSHLTQVQRILPAGAPQSASTQVLIWDTLRPELHSTKGWMLLTPSHLHSNILSLSCALYGKILGNSWKDVSAIKSSALGENEIWVPEQIRQLTTAYDSSSQIQCPLLASMSMCTHIHVLTYTHTYMYIYTHTHIYT